MTATKTLKVFGGTGQARIGNQYRQIRMFCACNSKERLVEIVGTSFHEVKHHWSVTGNDLEVKIATENPYVLFGFDPVYPQQNLQAIIEINS